MYLFILKIFSKPHIKVKQFLSVLSVGGVTCGSVSQNLYLISCRASGEYVMSYIIRLFVHLCFSIHQILITVQYSIQHIYNYKWLCALSCQHLWSNIFNNKTKNVYTMVLKGNAQKNHKCLSEKYAYSTTINH